jgi:hypothetical protein
LEKCVYEITILAGDTLVAGVVAVDAVILGDLTLTGTH